MDVATQNLSPVEQKLHNWQPGSDLPGWFTAMRGRAIEAYFDLDLPDRSNEAWHYGDPRRFELTGLDIAHAEPGFSGRTYERICGLTRRPRRYACLSMVSGRVSEVSSSTPLRDAGVTVMSLRQALALRGDLIEPFWARQIMPFNGDRLIAGHYALVDNGFFVHIPRSIEAPEPIHLILESGEGGSVVSPHVLVVADAFSKADVFVHFVGGDSEERNLQLGMIQAHVDEGAKLTLTKIQHLGNRTNALTREASILGRDARFSSIAVHFGGMHVRHEVSCRLASEGASAELSGMHFVRNKQRYDFFSHQDHQAPHTSSNLLYKGAISDRGRASYQGMINVGERASETDAYQTNRNLLLSTEARSDSSPQLEIMNRNVSCSHGSTTANVGEDELFYLQTRGIEREQARRLLVSGFLAEVADRIPLSTVRDYAYNYVLERFN